MQSVNIEKATTNSLNVFTIKKWNCAESTLYGLLTGFGCSEDEAFEKVTAASGFNGGIGATRGVCGAASGGVMALGVLFGKFGLCSKNNALCSSLSAELIKSFEKEYGSSLCGHITADYNFHSDKRRKYCENMVAFAVRTCSNLINDNLA